MKKVFLIVLTLLTSINFYSQGWDIAAWIIANKLEDIENERILQFYQPLLQSYEGHKVILHPSNNIYSRFNFKTKNTKGEYDEDRVSQFIHNPYKVENVVYDVEDFFNTGCLFALVNDHDEHLYVQRGYRNLLENLAESFNDVFYSQEFFHKTINVVRDKFENKVTLVTMPLTVRENRRYSRCSLMVEREITELDSTYYVDVIIASNREISIKTDCFINLKNGTPLRYYNLEAKYTYNNDRDRYEYGVQIPLSRSQFKEFTETSIVDIRIFGIDITDIRNFYGKMFQYICKAVYDYE